MKNLIIILFIICIHRLAGQTKSDIIIRFDKNLKNNFSKNSTVTNSETYVINYTFLNEYLEFNEISAKEIITDKSLLKNLTVINASTLLKLAPKKIAEEFENKKVFIIVPNKTNSNRIKLREVILKAGFHPM